MFFIDVRNGRNVFGLAVMISEGLVIILDGIIIHRARFSIDVRNGRSVLVFGLAVMILSALLRINRSHVINLKRKEKETRI